MNSPPFPVLEVPGTSPTFAARVFSYVDFTGDCWEWTGANKDGYGVIGRGARGAGNMQAHRAVRELLVGPIPGGLTLDHLCRNHACVNPDHNEPVTSAVNKARGFSSARLYALRPACPYGHPKDGVARRKKGKPYRYCKTCARIRSAERYQPKGPRQVCKYGHDYTPGNTYTDKRGHRACKTCKADRQRQARKADVQALLNGQDGGRQS